jgi:hypothetical protein
LCDTPALVLHAQVNNGRLAMVAMLGFGAQAALTRVGPIQNFADVYLNVASTFTYGDELAQNPAQVSSTKQAPGTSEQ